MFFKNYAYTLMISVLMSLACPMIAYTPVLVGSFDTDGFVLSISVAGNYAYVADHDQGLKIIDVSNPAAPVLVGSIATGDAHRVIAVGNYLYLADGVYGLKIFNITNPVAPVLVGSLGLGMSATNGAIGLTIVGNYAYIPVYEKTLKIVNIANPSAPYLVSSLTFDDHVFEVTVVGNYAYVGNDESGFKVVDVSNLAAPVVVGSLNLGGYCTYEVAIVGNYAYVANSWQGLSIINITNPFAPVLVGSLDTTNAGGVKVVGNYAYLADNQGGLKKIDITNPAAPFLAESLETDGSAVRLIVAGDYVYLADYDKGLKIIQVQEHAAPTLSSSSSTGMSVSSTGTFSSSTGVSSLSSCTGSSSSSSSTGMNGVSSSSSSSSTGSVPLAPNPVAYEIVKSGKTNTGLSLSADDFIHGFSDIDGYSLEKIKITSLPIYGTLKLSRNNIVVNQEIAVGNLSNLMYVPDVNWNGTDSFTWEGFDGMLYSNDDAEFFITIDKIAEASFCSEHPYVCYVVPPVVAAAGTVAGVMMYVHKKHLWCFSGGQTHKHHAGVQLANNIP